jgi:hypothetical protein|nr:MAG TPA: hypothetical protein [Crassvirales sp.]
MSTFKVPTAKDIILFAVIVLLIICGYCIQAANNTIDRQYQELKAYREYYNNVEIVLDSLNVGEDGEILLTPTDSNYLESKFKLDSLTNRRLKVIDNDVDFK